MTHNSLAAIGNSTNHAALRTRNQVSCTWTDFFNLQSKQTNRIYV